MKKVWSGFLIFLGFWLSPLSPWNDLFTNIPMAYAFAFVFSFGIDAFFLPTFVLGYWLSNIAGFILMHYGYVHIKEDQYSFREHWKSYLITTTGYTILIVALIQFGILPTIDEIKDFIN